MQTFSEFIELNEVFNKVLPYKWTQRSNDFHKASFTAPNGKQYLVALKYFEPFKNYNGEDYEGYWNLNFRIEDDRLMRLDKEFDILGTGDQFVVFATVIAVLKDFVSRVRPTRIEFSASEPSRIKLYNRFIALVGRSLIGYKGTQLDQGEYLIAKT